MIKKNLINNFFFNKILKCKIYQLIKSQSIVIFNKKNFTTTTIINSYLYNIFSNFASAPLPQPIPNIHQPNELDRNIYMMREKVLKSIVKKCEKIPNMEFKYVIEELENLSRSLSHLELEVDWLVCFFYT